MELVVAASPPLQGAFVLPGDKSQTHRALLLAALASGPVRLHHPLRAGVVDAAITVLRALGAEVSEESDGLTIVPPAIRPTGALGEIHCGRSATTLRLAAGILAGLGVKAVLTGDESLSRRPMERMCNPLRLLGADIRTTAGKPPVMIAPAALRGAEIAIDSPSAQVQTAVAFAALQAEGPTRITWSGPLRDHTARLLKALGAPIESAEDSLSITGPFIVPSFERVIPGDPSAGAFLAAAALLTGGTVTLPRVGVNPGRMGFYEAIARMGASVSRTGEHDEGGEPVADLAIGCGALHALELEGSIIVRMIDELPVLAALASRAAGVTRIRDASELRLKESDRIDALVAAFGELGVVVDAEPDGFTIRGPQRVRGGVCDPRGDHRLAMSLALLGLVADTPVVVRGAEVVGESFPGFVKALEGLGARVSERP